MLSFLWSGHWRLSTSGRRRFPNEKCWHKSTNNWLLRISVHGSKCLFALHRNILKGTTFYNELKSTTEFEFILEQLNIDVCTDTHCDKTHVCSKIHLWQSTARQIIWFFLCQNSKIIIEFCNHEMYEKFEFSCLKSRF